MRGCRGEPARRVDRAPLESATRMIAGTTEAVDNSPPQRARGARDGNASVGVGRPDQPRGPTLEFLARTGVLASGRQHVAVRALEDASATRAMGSELRVGIPDAHRPPRRPGAVP